MGGVGDNRDTLQGFVEDNWILQKAKDTKDWAMETPKKSICIALSGILIAAPGLESVPLLHTAGVTSARVARGSLAASLQSSIGNVAAESSFAIAQSAGGGGVGFFVCCE